MTSFLEVAAHDLDRLSPEAAVDLFRRLLWADASIYNVRIDVPSVVDAPDGGIDATVRIPDGAPPPGGPSVLRPGLACYQIKTGRISIGSKRDRRRLLYGLHPASTELLPRVKECLRSGGTLVFALFGSDVPAPAADAADLLRQDLPRVPAYEGARIEVWLQNELIGHLGRHPALRRALKGGGHESYLDHRRWGALKDMDVKLVRGKQHAAFIRRIRRAISSAGGPVDVRLAGPPGSGKTRLAHEITRASDLAHLVLYFENPAPLEDNRVLNALAEDKSAHAILVVDECDADERGRIAAHLAGAGGRIRLVTIFNKKDADDAHDIPELGEAEIKRIIQGYKARVDDDNIDVLASLCTPSPRYAHRLADRMRSDPAGFFRHPLDQRQMHRNYIAGRLDIDSGEYLDREAVLAWFGLFAMVGHDPPHDAESAFLARKVEEHMDIPTGKFDMIVDELRDLKILQGYKTLYVAPSLLHLWLWGEWWRLHGRRFDIGRILPGWESVTEKPELDRLFEWFVEMFANASASPEATRAARQLLATDGPFGGDGGLLEDRRGAKLFLASSKGVPDAALALLSGTVATWDDDRLERFRTGRREVAWAMEAIAYRSKNLGAVAKVLLRLAANENEDVSNSATGIFVGLFSPAHGKLATTPAGAEERLALLARLLDDPDRRVRRLALQACDRALESVHFARIDHDKGVILTAPMRTPDGGDMRAYRKVLGMLCGRAAAQPRDESLYAARIVLKRAPELARLAGLTADVAGALRSLHDKGLVDDETLLEKALMIIRVDGGKMGSKGAAAWKKLAARVDGEDYASRMRRYVKMNIAADIVARGGGARGKSERDRQMTKLAAETLRDKGRLAEVSVWLFGPSVHGAVQFGDELGRQDRRFSMLGDLIKAASDARDADPDPLLGAYLERVHERNPALWEKTMASLADNRRLAPLLPQIAWRSGISDGTWDLIAGLYRRKMIAKKDIAIFAHAGRPCRMPDRAFEEAVAIMLDSPAAVDMRYALALLAGRCECAKPRRSVPLDALHMVVADDLFLSGAGGEDETGMLAGHMWAAAARRLIEDDPDRIPALADALFGAMGHDGGVFGPHGIGGAWPVLDLMASTMPGQVWESASRHIAVPPDARSRRILAWLGGSAAGLPGQDDSPVPLDLVPLDAVWGWVDEDRAARAPLLAYHAPKDLRRGKRRIARDLLARYGADKNVRAAMRHRFLSGTWIGSGADHFAGEKKRYESQLRSEKNPHIRLWLEEMIEGARARLDMARAGDERLP